MTDKVLQSIASIKNILSNVRCNMFGCEFDFNVREHKGSPYLQITFDAPDTNTGIIEKQFCRKWSLQYTMSTSEIVRTAHLATQGVFDHEREEEFRYKGIAIYSPHTDVESLVTMLKLPEYSHDVRVPELLSLGDGIGALERHEFCKLLHSGFKQGMNEGWSIEMYDVICKLNNDQWFNFASTIHVNMTRDASVDCILTTFLQFNRRAIATTSLDETNGVVDFFEISGRITEERANSILEWFKSFLIILPRQRR